MGTGKVHACMHLSGPCCCRQAQQEHCSSRRAGHAIRGAGCAQASRRPGQPLAAIGDLSQSQGSWQECLPQQAGRTHACTREQATPRGVLGGLCRSC